MGMVERGLGADAHELARPDLDHRHARVVVEMGNDRLRHVELPRLPNWERPQDSRGDGRFLGHSAPEHPY